MKKLLFALCLLFGAAVAVNAQDSTSTQDQSSDQYRTDEMNQDQDDKDKKEIAVSELPPAVSAQLQSQDYSGWTISKAFKKEKDGETIYAVELKNGDEMKKVKFDAQGNVLKEKEKKDRDQK
jgi:hypothetical protein